MLNQPADTPALLRVSELDVWGVVGSSSCAGCCGGLSRSNPPDAALLSINNVSQ